MKIGKKQAYYCFCLLITAVATLGIGSLESLTIGVIVCWAIGMFYSVRNIGEKFTMFSFNVGFFVFLIGGYVLHWITEHDFQYFSNSVGTIRHTCICLLITICIFNVFSIFFTKKNRFCEKNENSDVQRIQKQSKSFSQIIVVLLVVSFICELMVEITTTSIIKRTSYELSMTVSTGLPGFITSISSYYYILLFMYWAIFPKRKGTMISFCSLVLIELIILVSGERGEPISLFLTMIFYIILRNKKGIHNIKITRRMVLTGIILVPFLLISLQTLSYSRVNRDYDVSNKEAFTDFFETQGGSVKIIANAYDLEDKITNMGGHSFVTGTVRNYLKNNIFTRMIFGKSKTSRSVADAYSGDSFLATYGYAYSPVTYKKNVGSGSTYIAEVYQDGGYLFLVLFNIFVAWLIYKIDSVKVNSIIKTCIVLNIFRYMCLLPRGIALQWLTSTFAIQNLVLFIGMYFLIQVGNKQSKQYSKYNQEEM